MDAANTPVNLSPMSTAKMSQSINQLLIKIDALPVAFV